MELVKHRLILQNGAVKPQSNSPFMFVLSGVVAIAGKAAQAALTAVLAAAGDVQNGDCIGPRGPFGISGYPHRTKFCRNVKKHAARASQ
jgi:hypothetical protein